MIYELTAILCGLILPRLVLSHYGSSYNGILSSISQFLQGITLLQAGVGNVAKAALYKPLVDGDTEKISSIVKTTQQFMHRVAGIFAVLLGLFACIYPLWVSDEFSWFFSFSLVIILSVSTFSQYFFGIHYQVLLQAAQREYVIHIVQISSIILNTLFATWLILSGCSIHVVKLYSAAVFGINPIVINLYARRKFNINIHVRPDTQLIQQRWDAFAQELALFVHTNTDLMVLTIFSNLREVSVYTVYNSVIKNIRRIVDISASSIGVAFGDMIARRQYDLLEKNLRVFELIAFSMVAIIYTTAGLLIIPFVRLYTQGVSDVNYIRPLFTILFALSEAFGCIRLPYQSVVESAGHFRQNRNGALWEAGLNIVISVLAVVRFGLVGVVMGTLVATVFRSVQYSTYLSKYIIPRSMWWFWGHVVVCGATALLVVCISQSLILPHFQMTVLSWLLCGVAVGMLSLAVTVVGNLLFYREEFLDLIKKMRKAVCKK